MACLVNSSAFAFSGISPLHSRSDSVSRRSNFPYRTPTTVSIKNMPSKQDALRFPPLCQHGGTTRQGRRKTLSPIKSMQDHEALPEGLKPELMPKHVAIILDGNRRWAKEKGLSMELGHLSGGRVIKNIAFLCNKWGVKVLSIFAFSTENWTRPKEEVDFLMGLFEEVGQTYMDEVTRYNVKISAIGDKSKLPEPLQELVATAEETTRGNTGLHLLVALNYSGRYDIMQATKSIAGKVKDGIFQVEDINEILFEKELKTGCAKFPNPDLLIRTSGEQRISNFYLWQLAYTEIFFSKKKFPDFNEEDFIEALSSFQKRERRYGGNK
ncbi:dehydrodolichyl diphosphate synthase 2-like [Olea europaea var. sylvestris]|uniref:dehydrodolichyl diphosphate synthase 2-like n=1 Tax=Olea europaea var. sylvestris TaxID=158386 RepID=UPI000C1D05B9|nr:dehydrodolichyl diphosphate synthase 2-like [Olea europaea var. sylvestris]